MGGGERGGGGWGVGGRGGGNAGGVAGARRDGAPSSPSGGKARRKGAAHMRHSSAVVENLRFRLDERAGCRGGSASPNVLIFPGPPGHGGRPLGGLSCFWA